MDEESKIISSLNLLVKSSVFVLIGILISKVLAYTFRIVIARYYGPEVYGLYLLGLSTVLWVATIAALGLPEGVVRFVSLYRGKNEVDKIRLVLRRSILVMIFLGFILGILLFYLSDFIAVALFDSPELSIYLKIFSLSIPFGLISNVLLSSLRAFEKIGWYSFIFNILHNVVMVLTLVYLIFIGFSGVSTVISFVASSCAMVIAGVIVARVYLKKYFSRPQKSEKGVIRDLFSYSLPLLFSGIVGSFLVLIDVFFIGYFQGVESVGFYNAAVPIAALLGIAPGIFMEMFFPLINKAYAKKDDELIKELSKQVSKWIFFINMPVAILMLLFPGALINLLFGEEYLVAEVALQVLSAGMFIQTASLVPKNLIAMVGKSKALLIDTIAVGVLNAVLNIILIPKFGIVGAASGTSASYAVLAVTLFIQAKSSTGILPLRRKMFSVLISVASAAALVLALRQFVERDIIGLILLFSAFCLACIVMFFLTGSLDKQDKRILKLLFKRLDARK